MGVIPNNFFGDYMQLKRSVLENYINGNFEDLTREDLLSLVQYYELAADTSYTEAGNIIIED
jgi:hypothetical protein